MNAVNSLSKIVPRTQLRTLLSRTLSTSEGLLRECGSGGKKPRDAEDICQASKPCKSGTKKKSKNCVKLKEDDKYKDFQPDVPPDVCSRQAALDCARKLEELQKQWEAVARAVERAEVAAQQAGQSNKVKGCPVKPPPKPEKEGSSMPIILGLFAVIAGVAYYLYTQMQEGEGTDGKDEDKDNKKEE